MICAACGTENPASKRFCRGCGASLAAACPACGGPIAQDDRFCGECGTLLAAPEAAGPAGEVVPLATPAEPATERRLVTVLFADLVGFTTLSESRDVPRRCASSSRATSTRAAG